MQEEPTWKRTIVYHASRDALAPKTDVILNRLGYRLLFPETFEKLQEEDRDLRPEMLLVDERRLAEIDAYEDGGVDGSIPIVLLTGQYGTTGADSRIVGAVKRPAGIHDLYRLMQQVFEDTPRSTPRVATQLLAHCERGDRHWDGRVLSLSENGCLIRSPEPIQLGQRIRLAFSLPRSGELSLDAEASYQLLPDIGLVFNAVPPTQRETLERFVHDSLAAG
jgi:hypothetical protein